MSNADQMVEAVEEPVQSGRHAPKPPKPWLPKDVFFTVVLAIFLSVALWVGVSSGIDYIHLGRPECVFSHDRYSDMHLQCADQPIGNTGAPLDNTGGTSGNTGVPLTNTGASIYNPTG